MKPWAFQKKYAMKYERCNKVTYFKCDLIRNIVIKGRIVFKEYKLKQDLGVM